MPFCDYDTKVQIRLEIYKHPFTKKFRVYQVELYYQKQNGSPSPKGHNTLSLFGLLKTTYYLFSPLNIGLRPKYHPKKS